MGPTSAFQISDVEISCIKRKTVKILSILFHDIIAGNFDESGFPGKAAARYKLTREEFRNHLTSMAKQARSPAMPLDVLCRANTPNPFLLTVDDGGVSAVYLAVALERLNWRANFFVTTDRIDTKSFLSTDQLRWLRRKGHVIGSHSCSHPYRMSELADDRLREEWSRSSETLSGIVKENIMLPLFQADFIRHV
jgi:peptidoglycan/xylan/chitin deacetylase (PgdA/CDA1 family)